MQAPCNNRISFFIVATSFLYCSATTYIKIGRGIVYTAMYEFVKTLCTASSRYHAIQKAIREGVKTVRLHDKKAKERELRTQQIQVLASPELDNCDAEFIESQLSEDEGSSSYLMTWSCVYTGCGKNRCMFICFLSIYNL